jgi:hypothetical protein
MIEIRMDIGNVMMALAPYLEKKYGIVELNLDIYDDSTSIVDHNVWLEYHVKDPIVYKKHKNGKVVKDKWGHRVEDIHKTKWKNKTMEISDFELSFHIGEVD